MSFLKGKRLTGKGYLVTLHPTTNGEKNSNHKKNHLVQHHRKVLLSTFHLNGYTLGFHLQTQKLEPPCTA